MRADRRRNAPTDPMEDHSAASGSRPDLSRHFRLHAVLERVYLRADLHILVGEQDRSSRRDHRTGRRRRVPLGFADGRGAVRLAAGGDPVLVFRRVLCLEPDRSGQGIAAAGWDGRLGRLSTHPLATATPTCSANLLCSECATARSVSLILWLLCFADNTTKHVFAEPFCTDRAVHAPHRFLLKTRPSSTALRFGATAGLEPATFPALKSDC